MSDKTKIKKFLNEKKEVNTAVIEMAELYAKRRGDRGSRRSMGRAARSMKEQRKVKVVVREPNA